MCGEIIYPFLHFNGANWLIIRDGIKVNLC